MFSNVARRLVTSIARTLTGKATNQPVRRRPRLLGRAFSQFQQLEDRCVPAAVTVSVLGDAVQANGMPVVGDLRWAVAQVNTGAADTINFDTTKIVSPINLDSSFTFNKNVTINGTNVAIQMDPKAPAPCQFASFVVGTTDVINGAVIQGFTNPASGGAITNNGKLTLNNCTLQNDSATTKGSSGGAIYDPGTLVVSNCTFFNDTATLLGGAIYEATADGLPAPTVTITDTTFKLDTASLTNGGNGGAIEEKIGTLNIQGGCQFIQDSAFNGGGLSVEAGATAVFTNSNSFSNNNANAQNGKGGAMYVAGTVSVQGAVTMGNDTASIGSGYYVKNVNNNGSVTIVAPNGKITLNGNDKSASGG